MPLRSTDFRHAERVLEDGEQGGEMEREIGRERESRERESRERERRRERERKVCRVRKNRLISVSVVFPNSWYFYPDQPYFFSWSDC